MSQDPRPQASALDAIIPTNPLAALSCYMGIFSILCCFLGVLLGPGAVVLGVLALKKWTLQESSYGATTSKIRAWVGIVTGAIGTVTGLVALVLLVMEQMKGR